MAQSAPDISPLFERFLALPTRSLELALSGAADIVAAALGADKVDAFLLDSSRNSLVALGRSCQPLSELQRRSGLHILPLANGGRIVEVFESGTPFLSGELMRDLAELRGIREVLKVESQIAVPFEVAGCRKGVLGVSSQQANLWEECHLRFAESVARWVAVVAHRAQLLAEVEREAVEMGRRAAADELVTAVAHDLRNYLNPLELRLLALGKRAQRDGREDDTRETELALRSLSRIADFVTDLLDVARLDHGLFAMTKQPVDLTALVDDIASTMSTVPGQLQRKASEQVLARVDPLRVRQCLENLVANAIKHTRPGSLIYMIVRRDNRSSGEWVEVQVVDEGPGIPEHLLPHVFERFVTGKRGGGAGLGLGLFLAKRIAVMHGGDLTVDSKPGLGTRFVLTLPGS